ncbi:spore-associated protein A [Streptomyces sp. NPDC033538]|uniref:spore-associated protein A n=1 Tax=Streptomyces sp. NPDC033538 TaxID=3155367 RepID=UPI0033FADCD5
MRKKIAAVFLSAIALIIAPLATNASATTQSGAVSLARSACGSAYNVTVEVGDQGLPDRYYWHVLLYNPSNGYNCAVLVKDSGNSNYGSPSSMSVAIRAAGGSWHRDSGSYTTYAGPVYVHAPSTCVYLNTKVPNHEWTSFALGCN